MKVLVHTYDTAYLNDAGGVRNRIEQYVAALRKYGIRVDYFNKYTTNLRDYDVLHIFKLDASFKNLIDYAKSLGVKVVVSSIVNVGKGWIVDFYWSIKKVPFATIYRQIFDICDNVDAIVVETPREAHYLSRYYRVDSNKLVVIPNGVEEISTRSKQIYCKIPKEDYCVLIARFDENKNQLSVIKALKNKNINVVLIGGPPIDCSRYYERCIEEAKDASNIYFLGWLNSGDELFKSAIRNAKVLICPSFKETFGLTIIEGILAGAIPIVSDTLPILGYEELCHCITFNPYSTKDILEKVKKAMAIEKLDEQFKKCIKEKFCWERIAEDHIDLYRRL